VKIFIRSKSAWYNSVAQVEESTLDIVLNKLRMLGGYHTKYQCCWETDGEEDIFVPFEEIQYIKEIK
jgi:hypothetical protein